MDEYGVTENVYRYMNFGRLFQRLSGLVYGDLIPKVQCVQSAFIDKAKTMYEGGECAGFLASISFDTSLG